ncbi:hypothetical protein PVE99_04345 [Priestia megaterium]|uniref:Uncharacterized protein n=1 Tax=Priestia megaterium TaxID=1404 RepID=A0ABD4WN46_PRIMG|nr:hypothetical protein [Priestia megaterium]MDD9781636.1 hypothetical protein [Priestia megaterium]
MSVQRSEPSVWAGIVNKIPSGLYLTVTGVVIHIDLIKLSTYNWFPA